MSIEKSTTHSHRIRRWGYGATFVSLAASGLFFANGIQEMRAGLDARNPTPGQEATSTAGGTGAGESATNVDRFFDAVEKTIPDPETYEDKPQTAADIHFARRDDQYITGGILLGIGAVGGFVLAVTHPGRPDPQRIPPQPTPSA